MEVLGWRSDAELVDGVRRGEDFAFGRLFERWFGRVLGEAQDILGDPQAAAEVATDTFHALWYHLDRLDDPEGFGAWAVETSRTFARERLAAPGDREKTAPVPLLTTAPDAAAAVAVALVARGLPSAAGLGEALHGAAGFAGSVPGPAGFAGAAPAAPSPMGFAGVTLPAPPQTPPAGFAGGAPGSGFAGGAPGSGFAGTPGSGSILGGSVGQAADLATQAMPSLGAFGAAAEEPLQRLHRYEPPSRGGLLGSPQALAGIAATLVLVLVGALLLTTRGDDGETATDAVSTTVPPAAPSASAPSSAPAATEAQTTASTASTTSASSDTSTTDGPATTSTTRRTTTSTTRATTASTATTTATTRATTTATSASTTGSTTATTSATTATTEPTTASTEPTTTTTSVTRTTPTTGTTTSTTVPKPVISTFTVVADADGSCAGAVAKLLPYTASWSATNARSSSLAVNGVTYDGGAKDSRNFCALSGTRVTLTVTGPGGDASLARTTR